MVVDEDDEEEEEDEDELEEEEEEEEVEVVLEDVDEVVDVVEEELDEETLSEVVEELGVVVDSVEDGVWLDETVCDWVILLFDGPEVRTKYPPTAATITTTTIMPITAVLNAVRLPRANEGKRLVWSLWPIFSQEPCDLGVYYTCYQPIHRGETWKKFHSVTAGLEDDRPDNNPKSNV